MPGTTRTIEQIADELEEKANQINDLIEEAKSLKYEARMWTENRPNGKNIRLRILNLQPIIDL
jgi:hypothetical protein